ncbi:hypothetical protein D3C81_2218080 [compost metagenome]
MYLRQYEGQTWAVVSNFGSEGISLQLPRFGESDEVIISNSNRSLIDFNLLELTPYEAFAVKL